MKKEILLTHLHNIGKAQYMIKELLQRDIFDTLSKHNDWWNCPVDEIANEKLEEARCQLSGIQYELWEIQEALSAPEDEE
jgi:hypothetical protein